MKKILVVLVVLALTVMSSMAFAAAEVTFDGSVDIRSRALNDVDNNADGAGSRRRTALARSLSMPTGTASWTLLKPLLPAPAQSGFARHGWIRPSWAASGSR